MNDLVGLEPSQGLDYGQDYTFSFKLSAWGVPVGLDDIIPAVSQLQDLGGVDVKESATGALGLNLSGGIWDVSFTFQGDDSSATVGSVAQEISNAVSATHWLVSFNLVGAFTGSIGVVGSGEADKGLDETKNIAGDLSKSMLYLGIAIVLVVVAIKLL